VNWQWNQKLIYLLINKPPELILRILVGTPAHWHPKTQHMLVTSSTTLFSRAAITSEGTKTGQM